MVTVELREIVAVAAAKLGVLLEQALLNVETERLRLAVDIVLVPLADLVPRNALVGE